MPASAAPRIVLGLGANLGAPRRQLLQAIAALSRELGPLAVAPLYRSAPMSPIAQPDFLNTVVLAASDWEPERLLALAKELEARAGRVDGPRWGPRPLDVDLLLVGDLRRDDAALTLPHPRLHERGFVLAPLADVAPDLHLRVDGARSGTAAELLAALPREAWPARVPWTGDEHAR